MTSPTTAVVEAALRRAFSLGQNYWQQTDNSQYAKSDVTAQKFVDLLAETLAALSAAPEPADSVHSVESSSHPLPLGAIASRAAE